MGMEVSGGQCSCWLSNIPSLLFEAELPKCPWTLINLKGFVLQSKSHVFK